ncbi:MULTISPECIES: hypothetical protein [Bacteroides]|uniref:hypothetical protein n=1 Tax=Bacteroides TaxID=816 RepID=UPI00319EAE54
MEYINNDLFIKLLGVFISFFGVIVPLYKFITEKNLSQRDLRFKTYHQLIKQLVEPEDGKDHIMLDRQIATCFELRNFPEYFEITKRILSDLKVKWEQDPRNKRITSEIDHTIKYIETYNKGYLFIFQILGLKIINKQIASRKMYSFTQR